jgi:hypothetical protein
MAKLELSKPSSPKTTNKVAEDLPSRKPKRPSVHAANVSAYPIKDTDFKSSANSLKHSERLLNLSAKALCSF